MQDIHELRRTWLDALGRPLGGVIILAAGLGLGVAAELQPVLTLAGAIAVLVCVWTADRPVRGAYLLLLCVPLVVGIGRGQIVPVLRPNEALIVFLLGIVVLRGTLTPTAGQVRLGPVTAIDRAFALLFVFGSVLPLAVQLFRSDAPSAEDTFQLLSLLKYYLGYRLVLAVVGNERQMLTATHLMVLASGLVALVGLLQYARVAGVPELLAAYYSAGQVREALELRRATSTLGVWQALASYLAVHAALVLGLLSARAGGRDTPRALRGPWRGVLVGALLTNVAGALATATLTAVLGLLIAVGVMAALGGYWRKAVLGAVPLSLAAALVFWPAIQERWEYQFHSWGAGGDLPVTWEYRITNLTTVFWPVVQDNLVFGVAPSVSPDLAWQFPENQQMYLLYQGGLLYVAAYFVFMWVVLRTTWRYQRRLAGPAQAVGRAAFVAWLLMLVLGLFDPHLTMAGEADAAWALLALATGAATRAAETA